jgi:putative peptide zinc metalloprotease protein
MAEFLFSSHWYRVANLHPRLRSHVRVSRQLYRDRLWFLLQDQTSGRHHRVNQNAYQFIGRMDGNRTVQEIWDVLVEDLGDDAPTQDETIQILCQLSDADLLQCEATPDVADLFRRRDERSSKKRQSMINPFAFRVPLFDPAAVLDRFMPLARMLFNPVMLLVWFGFVAFAMVVAFSNWTALSAQASVHMLTPRYLFLLWLVYPLIKAVHELGHAVAVRVWGGQVNEMGVTLFLLVPVPYVDASASAVFRDKFQRMAVAAIGIMVELFLAAIATIVWLNVEDGIVRDIAFVTMLVGGVSTVLFNGNPLLKFDGYYIFSDALDMPNLAQRSQAYLLYLAQRYLLRMTSAISEDASTSEKTWLLAYGLASWLYRLFVTVLIVLWVSTKSALIGIAIGFWIFVSMIIKPIGKAVHFLLTSPRLGAQRLRAWAITGGAAIAIIATIWLVPMPLATRAEGIVWQPEQSRIRAATDGFIDRILVGDGSVVQQGDILLEMSDPALNAQHKESLANLASLEVSYQEAIVTNPVRAQSVLQEKARVMGDLNEIENRIAQLTVRSPSAGRFVMPHGQDMVSNFVTKGAVLAHVLTSNNITIRVAVAQDDIALVRARTRDTQVTLKEVPTRSLQAVVMREVPAATQDLPSAALADKAGGRFVTDPADPKGLRTLEPFFLFDVEVPESRTERVGGRAWVRFDHGSEPLTGRILRTAQQLMLRHFSHDK